MTVSSSIAQSLREIIIDVAKLKIAPEEIGDDAHLIDDCSIDSTSIVDLLLSIEQKFAITIDEEELDTSLFERFATLAQFVSAKCTAAGVEPLGA